MTGVDSEALSHIGTVLKGKYRLDSVIGSGGVATVYAATHRNKKRFAIKMLHREFSAHDDVRAGFLREGYAANSVGHPGVVNVLDDDTADDGSAFLVMELLEGRSVESLRERRGGQLPVPVVLAIAEQLLDVLAVAHARGIVHRDIKPENLFVTRSGQLKVLDFGIARAFDVAQDNPDGWGSGKVFGTPVYMAPEQAAALDGEIDPQTDVWGVGATLFTLLSGHTVHEGETVEQVALLAATKAARSLASVCEVPAPVVELVDRALAFAKNDRWSSAWEMRDEARLRAIALLGNAPPPEFLAKALPNDSEAPPSSRELLTVIAARTAGPTVPAPPPEMEGQDAALPALPPAPLLPVLVVPALAPSANTPAPSAPVTLDASESSVPPAAAGPTFATRKRVAVFAAAGAALGIVLVLAMLSQSRGPAPAAGAQGAAEHPAQTTATAPTATATAAASVTPAPSAAPSASIAPSKATVPELSVEDLPAATTTATAIATATATAAPPTTPPATATATATPTKPVAARRAKDDYGF
jgi:serine/threonine-protein kinase